MKVALITPDWGHPWIDGYKAVCEERGHTLYTSNVNTATKQDIVIHAWADGARPDLYRDSVNVVFLRRYELFTGAWKKIAWKHVAHLFCVNDWIAEQVSMAMFELGINVPISVVYNAVAHSKWEYRDRSASGKSNRIGMVCHIHPKKNLPLAMQILGMLPHTYTLHIAGSVQDQCTAEYLNHLAVTMRRKVYFYGHIDRAELNHWWDLMDVCLSTSISEGNPNNVNEAMAKGIKPVVHNWPGALRQYPPECVFHTANEAAEIISGECKSARYYDWSLDKFNMDNLRRVLDTAERAVPKTGTVGPARIERALNI